LLIQQILLKIFHIFQNERTVSAAFHLLKGKRSGQTIQDVGFLNFIRFLDYYQSFLEKSLIQRWIYYSPIVT